MPIESADKFHAIACLVLIVLPYLLRGPFGKKWYSWSTIAATIMCLSIIGWVFCGGECVCGAATKDSPDIKSYGITAACVFAFINSGSKSNVIPEGVKRVVSFFLDFMYIKSATMFAGNGWLRTWILMFGFIHLILTVTNNIP